MILNVILSAVAAILFGACSGMHFARRNKIPAILYLISSILEAICCVLYLVRLFGGM